MQGYVRVSSNERHDDGVQWWYWWMYEDGWAFARGGRVRKIRDARKAIREAHSEQVAERRVFLKRPTHKLGKEGELLALHRSPYEATTIHSRLKGET